MVTKIKLLLVIPTLNQSGGAQRVFTHLINHLTSERISVAVAVVSSKGYEMPELPNNIEFFDLGASRSRFSLVKLFRLIWRIRPRLVLSTMGYMNLLIVALQPFLPRDLKLVGRESNTVSMSNRAQTWPILFDLLYKILYRRFDCVIAQSEYMREDLVVNYKVPRESIVVINNPVDTHAIDEKLRVTQGKQPSDQKRLLAVGNLKFQKGYDRLLEVMCRLPTDFNLQIIGSGKEMNNLMIQSKALNLDRRVEFLGFQPNPFSFIASADLFVSGSRYEGFSNAIVEASYCGLPVIAFDSPGGTREVIVDGENGYLVEDGNLDGFAHAVKKAINHNFNALSIRARAKERFCVHSIVEQYKALIFQIAERG